jgi:hypothetical protein
MITKGTFEELEAEIDKCEVVCANCHRVRSAQRGWSTGRPIPRRVRHS